MELTERERQVWDELKEWERQLQTEELTDFTMMYDKWFDAAIHKFPEEARNDFFLKLDNWLFHLHAFIQNTEAQHNASKQIIGTARVFDEEIQQIDELKNLSIDQLTYIANHQIAKHRIISAVQGGLTGTGNSLFLSADLIAMAVINLKVVQLIAMSYGFDSKTPFELMVSLKVLYTATLPTRYQKNGWELLVEELMTQESTYFYEGSENFTDHRWLEEPTKQIAKSFLIMFSRKKLLKNFPIIGVVFGAGINYKLTKQVTEFAQKFYQYRYLLEKKGITNEFK